MKCSALYKLPGPQIAALERQAAMELDSIDRTDMRSLEVRKCYLKYFETITNITKGTLNVS